MSNLDDDPIIHARYYYWPAEGAGGGISVLSARPSNTASGHDALIATWNARDAGKVRWAWKQVRPGDIDYAPPTPTPAEPPTAKMAVSPPTHRA